MASDYEGKTVIQLKEMCRENGLPVSGTKSVLIERLQNFDETESSPPASIQLSKTPEDASTLDSPESAVEEMNEISCVNCGTILRVPTSYQGLISCPACKTKQQASGKATSPTSDSTSSRAGSSKTPSVEGLTNQQKSVIMMLVGVGIGLIAIWLALAEWNLWWDCEVDYNQAAGYDEMGCGQNTFFSTMFTSCCLLLPLGFFLASFGYNFGQNQEVTPQVHTGAVPYAVPAGQLQGHPPNQPTSPLPAVQQGAFGKAVQSTALGLGVGVATVTAIAMVAVVLIFMLFLFIAVTL